MYFQNSHIVAMVMVLAPLVGAAPAMKEVSLDMSTLATRNLTARNGRDNKKPEYGLQTCSDDPSYSTDKGTFKDGEGQYVGSDCNNGLAGKWQCWTDYYIVGYKSEYSPWEPVGSEIDCSTTDSCTNVRGAETRKCTTNSWAVGGELKAGLESKFSEAIGGKLDVSIKAEGGWSAQTCTTVSDSASCTWKDQKCHTLWRAERIVKQYGYRRRTCVSSRAGTNIPDAKPRNAPEDPYPMYTVGIKDWVVDLPGATAATGCAALCSDQTYPDPVPDADKHLIPN